MKHKVKVSCGGAHAQRLESVYIKGTTEALARVLTKDGIEVAHKPMLTLERFMTSPKDRRAKEKKPGAVYKLPCSD